MIKAMFFLLVGLSVAGEAPSQGCKVIEANPDLAPAQQVELYEAAGGVDGIEVRQIERQR